MDQEQEQKMEKKETMQDPEHKKDKDLLCFVSHSSVLIEGLIDPLKLLPDKT